MSELDDILRAYRGSVNQIFPLTKDNFKHFETENWKYNNFRQYIMSKGLSSNNFYITDSAINNTFYIDYNNGIYLDAYNFQKEIFEFMHFFKKIDILQKKQLELLQNKKYELFYIMIPETFRAYDFQKRYKDIETNIIADVWLSIYIGLDYGFDTWEKDVLEYVFQFCKPIKRKKPFEIYRGIGTESTPIEKSYSWTTDINKAYWFATRRSNGKSIARGIVNPKDVLFYTNERGEKEIIVRFKDVKNVDYFDIKTLYKL